MKALFLACSVSILLSSCAQKYVWYRPGASDLTFQRESAICELHKQQYSDQLQAQDRMERVIRDAYRPPYGGKSGLGIAGAVAEGLGSDPFGLQAGKQYDLCMRVLGWTQIRTDR
jgi:hypothetical protein